MPSTIVNERKRPLMNPQTPQPGLGLHLPDGVQRVLELAEDPRGAEQERHQPDGGATAPAPGFRALAIIAWIAWRPLLADELADLADELPLRRLLAEDQPRDGDGDEQQRCEREQAIEGKGARRVAAPCPRSTRGTRPGSIPRGVSGPSGVPPTAPDRRSRPAGECQKDISGTGPRRRPGAFAPSLIVGRVARFVEI